MDALREPVEGLTETEPSPSRDSLEERHPYLGRQEPGVIPRTNDTGVCATVSSKGEASYGSVTSSNEDG